MSDPDIPDDRQWPYGGDGEETYDPWGGGPWPWEMERFMSTPANDPAWAAACENAIRLIVAQEQAPNPGGRDATVKPA